MGLSVHDVRAITVGPETSIGGGTSVRSIFVHCGLRGGINVIELKVFGKSDDIKELRFFEDEVDARDYDPEPELGDADTGHR